MRILRLSFAFVALGLIAAATALYARGDHEAAPAAGSAAWTNFYSANISAGEAEGLAALAPPVASRTSSKVIVSKGSATIGPAQLTASWTGDNVNAMTADETDTSCNTAAAPPSVPFPGRCDDFLLTVNTAQPSGSFTVNVTAGTAADDYDLYIFDAAGNQVANSGNSNGVPENATVACPSLADGAYKVRVVYFQTVAADNASYTATATFKNTGVCAAAPVPTHVSTLKFAPSTLVSAHFIAGEPQLTMERHEAYTPGNAGIDDNRIFVDWPLSSRANTGQLNRSLDGGDSFRLLLDLTCASRNRPNCTTGGGGDTEEDVNLANGDTFFADQEVLVNEAFASSTDHGDSFPSATAVSNATTATDRQWIAATDNTQQAITSLGSPIEAFFTFHVPPNAYIQAVPASTHLPVAQPAPQLTNTGQTGQPRVDNNASSKGHGWIYYPYRGYVQQAGTFVATAPSSSYFDPRAWHPNLVSPNSSDSFPWVAIDRHGNAYLSYDSGGIVYYAYSPIDNPLNDPTAGGTPGTYWSTPVRVTPAAVTSAVFPEIFAGENGRIAVTWVGTTESAGDPNLAGDDVHWNIYAAAITNAASAAPTIDSGLVSHRVAHHGNICTKGTTCLGTQDRSFLDMIDVSMDNEGRIGVQFEDNYSTGFQDAAPDQSPFLYFAKQTVGPKLTSGTVNLPQRLDSATDAPGDATWPNRAYTTPGTNLPSLDETGASLARVGSNLVGHIPLATATVAQMQADIATFNSKCTPVPAPGCDAQRLLYILRFNTDSKVYFMAFQVLPNGTTKPFGGQLDTTNDEILNVGNPQGVVGAAYHDDGAAFQVTGGPTGGEITLSAPLSNFGLTTGSKLWSVTAFATAGPTEGNDMLSSNVLRTVDATPPFDTQLAGPTAVGVRSFTVARSGHAVVLRWRTASEVGSLGFDLYRGSRTHRVRLNGHLIASGSGAGRSYAWRAGAAKKGTLYWLQEVHLDGSRVLHGPVRAG